MWATGAPKGVMSAASGGAGYAVFCCTGVVRLCICAQSGSRHPPACAPVVERKEGYPGRADALAQTTDGFLWIGGDYGLFRFDGIHFERYVSGHKLLEGPVRGLLALHDGSLWVAYRLEKKIFVLRNGSVKSYSEADGVTSNPTTIVQDHEGTIWANTETGVIRFNGARWEHIGRGWNFPEDVPHTTSDTLFVDSRGTLWAAVNHTILYLKQGSKRFEATGAFAGWTASIAEAPGGTMWLSDPLSYVRALTSFEDHQP